MFRHNAAIRPKDRSRGVILSTCLPILQKVYGDSMFQDLQPFYSSIYQLLISDTTTTTTATKDNNDQRGPKIMLSDYVVTCISVCAITDWLLAREVEAILSLLFSIRKQFVEAIATTEPKPRLFCQLQAIETVIGVYLQHLD